MDCTYRSPFILVHPVYHIILKEIPNGLKCLSNWWCNTWTVPDYPESNNHGIMGRRFPDGGLLRYRKWVPQQLEDINKQESGDSWPMGVRHGNTAANHTDLLSVCGWTCVFAVQAWSNLWDLMAEPPLPLFHDFCPFKINKDTIVNMNINTS